MAYSYTEKKRIRKDFGKLPQVMEQPFLLATQLDSYMQFTQANLPEEDRRKSACKLRLTLYSRSSVIPVMPHWSMSPTC